jgi:hypothetical protein
MNRIISEDVKQDNWIMKSFENIWLQGKPQACHSNLEVVGVLL